jgi:3-hydroxyacyl-[acyl-carrier-protein] dehydratase
VDRILELIPGKMIRAVKRIDGSEDFFADHFPGFPIVPGVLLTEMMAQAAGKCLDSERNPRGKAMLAKIVSASFRDWVHPDQDAIIHADIRANQETFATANCHIEIGSKKVCTAELLFAFISYEKLITGYVDEVLESYLAETQ